MRANHARALGLGARIAQFSIAVGFVFFGTISAALSAPVTYEFKQQTSTVPGFNVTSLIRIDGDFSDLPTLSQPSLNPVVFGDLLGFSITFPPFYSYGLGNFTPTDGPDLWSISPSGIYWNDTNSDFRIQNFVGTSTISFNTDGPDRVGCRTTGVCFATGAWVAIPEPSTLAIFGGALGVGSIMARRKLKRPVPRSI